MKNLKFTLLVAIVMTLATSVGFANVSPPKTEIYPVSILKSNDAITMENSFTQNESFVIENHVDVFNVALVGETSLWPEPKVIQLNKFIYFYENNANIPITKIEKRCRSSDIKV